MDGAGQVARGSGMSATKNQKKGAFMGSLQANPCQKVRITARFEEQARDSGISRYLPFAASNYSDHP